MAPFNLNPTLTFQTESNMPKFKLKFLSGKSGQMPTGTHTQVEVPPELKAMTVVQLKKWIEEHEIEIDYDKLQLMKTERKRENLLKHLGVEKTYYPGQILECEEDLAKRWPEKFEPVLEYHQYAQDPYAPPQEVQAAAPKFSPANYQHLDKLNEKELKDFAEGEEIDLKGAKGKEAMLKAIKTALGQLQPT